MAKRPLTWDEEWKKLTKGQRSSIKALFNAGAYRDRLGNDRYCLAGRHQDCLIRMEGKGLVERSPELMVSSRVPTTLTKNGMTHFRPGFQLSHQGLRFAQWAGHTNRF